MFSASVEVSHVSCFPKVQGWLLLLLAEKRRWKNPGHAECGGVGREERLFHSCPHLVPLSGTDGEAAPAPLLGGAWPEGSFCTFGVGEHRPHLA